MAKAHYVDNEKFYAALVERKSEVDLALAAGKEPPQITDYLGKCIFDICTHLAYMPSFINYSFRNEMIGDAIENCIEAIDKFDSVEYKKPFAYFTQISYWAFLRRIEKEKRQQYIKFKLLEEIPIDEMVEIQNHDTGDVHYRSVVDMVRENSYFNTKEYEDKLAAKRKPKNAIIEALEEDQDDDNILHA
jgi:hypothetical protein